jgi:hypothetical protein
LNIISKEFTRKIRQATITFGPKLVWPKPQLGWLQNRLKHGSMMLGAGQGWPTGFPLRGGLGRWVNVRGPPHEGVNPIWALVKEEAHPRWHGFGRRVVLVRGHSVAVCAAGGADEVHAVGRALEDAPAWMEVH